VKHRDARTVFERCIFDVYLELKDLVFVEAHFLEHTGQFTLVLRGDLVTGEGFVERRWSADEHLDVTGVVARLEHVLFEIVLVNETGLALPLLGWLVDEVVDLELIGVLLGNGVNLVLDENVVFGHVTVEEVNLGLVLRVLVDAVHQLVQRSDTGARTQQGDLLVHVGLPLVLGDRALDGKGVARLERVDVLGHEALVVDLDDKFEGTLLVWVGDRGVWSNDVLAVLLAGELGQDAAGGLQPEDLVLLRQFENKVLGVVGEGFDLGKLELGPLIGVGERLLGLGLHLAGRVIGNPGGGCDASGHGNPVGNPLGRHRTGGTGKSPRGKRQLA
jgi:hypothetical protein